MPDQSPGQRRIQVWRKSICLFKHTGKEEGPFHQAGYTDYVLEARTQENRRPDLIGLSDSHYTMCEITFSPNKDDADKYAGDKPSSFVETLAPSGSKRDSAGAPFLLTHTETKGSIDGLNLIQFSRPVRVILNNVKDQILGDILGEWKGYQYPVPSLNVSAVPESPKEEVREALVGVLKWAASKKHPVLIHDLVERILGDEYTSFSQKTRGDLVKKVTECVQELVKGDLQGFMKYDKSSKHISFTKEYYTTTQSRIALTKRIDSWMANAPETTLLHFLEADSDEEE